MAPAAAVTRLEALVDTSAATDIELAWGGHQGWLWEPGVIGEAGLRRHIAALTLLAGFTEDTGTEAAEPFSGAAQWSSFMKNSAKNCIALPQPSQ